MLIHKGFRFRVYPTPSQEKRLLAWENTLRFLWNLANEQRVMCYARPKSERRYPTAFDQINELTDLRVELPWLADVPRNVCAQILVELDKAWQRCFKKLARTPRWKRKGRDVLGLCEPHPKTWRLNGTLLHFPKLGPMRAVVHRLLEGKPKTCTIRRDGDQWFASIICEVEVSDPTPRVEPIVALDRGVINVVADSDGRIIESPRFYVRAMRRLAHAQRFVSRKKKGSRNLEKAKLRVARLHRKVRRQRDHFVHGLSSTYAKNHGTVVVEKLQIGGMVRCSRGLARGILDSGWGKLVEQLRYKLAWSGGTLVEVSAAYSSQTCHVCGHVAAESRRTQAEFVCVECGLVEHADVNAAMVLKSRANRSALLGEGTVLEAARRTKKRLRVARRTSDFVQTK
jgi:putative transposase